MTTLSYGTPEEAGMDPDRIVRLHDLAPTWVDNVETRSAVLLAARRGKIVFHEAYGPLTDKPGSPDLERDSIFEVSSVTKPILATAAMVLVEDGLLGLNRPLKEYIPEICGEGADDIEVQHLLTHTTGYREDDCWAHHASKREAVNASPVTPAPGQHQFIANYLKCMEDVKSWYAPGSQMDYCNHNFALLGEVVRRVSGQGPQDFMKQRVFDPLGMDSSRLVRDEALAARHVVRGDGVPAGSVAGNPAAGVEGIWLRSAPWGFLGLCTTARDLAVLGQTLLNGGTYGTNRLLSRPAVHEMTRNQLPGIGCDFFGIWYPEASWGLGWAIQGDHRWKFFNSTLVPKGTIYHSGSGGHQIWIDPVNEIVGVYLSVTLIDNEQLQDRQWAVDHFMNMVTAAVAD